ncbi:glycosyltransferase [Scandinavium sp. H11S7]|uniref:glycosyltransferase n=1 Tax=Scandinavium hiltneri TaxID=2926519 RepID=UPI0021661E77|nr:glycosyltransferase [Scandinavium hiltneri]MCS2156064.1 glycosyltransferase [Scandinavium hiltneri]
MTCRILVLLAAYNGKKWIDEQLNSILSQENVSVDILVSVDLSSDHTFDYIEKKYPTVNLLAYGKKYGSAGKNFYRLMLDAEFSPYDYIAFADQDDIWLSDKLSHAVNVIRENNIDAYSGNVTAFWDNGRQSLINKSQPQVDYDYFFEAAGPGCTYVFNKKLALAFQQFLRAVPESRNVALHDWLIYAYARSNHYRWIIDKESKMLYRQHENNQVGANESFSAAYKRFQLAKDGWYKKEVLKLIGLFKCDNTLLVKKIRRKSWIPSLYIILNIYKIRRRPRDRFAFLIFHIMRLI